MASGYQGNKPPESKPSSRSSVGLWGLACLFFVSAFLSGPELWGFNHLAFWPGSWVVGWGLVALTLLVPPTQKGLARLVGVLADHPFCQSRLCRFFGILALVLLLSHWAQVRQWAQDPGFRFLVVYLVFVGLASLLIDRKLGGARDWDLLAAFGTALLAPAIMVIPTARFGQAQDPLPRWLTLALTVSFLLTGSWILTLASTPFQ